MLPGISTVHLMEPLSAPTSPFLEKVELKPSSMPPPPGSGTVTSLPGTVNFRPSSSVPATTWVSMNQVPLTPALSLTFSLSTQVKVLSALTVQVPTVCPTTSPSLPIRLKVAPAGSFSCEGKPTVNLSPAATPPASWSTASQEPSTRALSPTLSCSPLFGTPSILVTFAAILPASAARLSCRGSGSSAGGALDSLVSVSVLSGDVVSSAAGDWVSEESDGFSVCSPVAAGYCSSLRPRTLSRSVVSVSMSCVVVVVSSDSCAAAFGATVTAAVRTSAMIPMSAATSSRHPRTVTPPFGGWVSQLPIVILLVGSCREYPSAGTFTSTGKSGTVLLSRQWENETYNPPVSPPHKLEPATEGDSRRRIPVGHARRHYSRELSS